MDHLVFVVPLFLAALAVFYLFARKLNEKWEAEQIEIGKDTGILFVEYGGLVIGAKWYRFRMTWPFSKLIVYEDRFIEVDRIREKEFSFSKGEFEWIQFRRYFPMIIQGFKVVHSIESYPRSLLSS